MQARNERYGARFQPPLLTYAWLIMFISCTSRPPVEFSHNGTKIFQLKISRCLMFSIVVEVEGKRKISAFPATYFKAGNTRNYIGA